MYVKLGGCTSRGKSFISKYYDVLAEFNVSRRVVNKALKYLIDRKITISNFNIEQGNVKTVKLLFPSETREDLTHTLVIGEYGVKCDCEASALRGYICSHIVAGLIILDMFFKSVGREFSIRSFPQLHKYIKEHGGNKS
ncbi:MAG: hypothetical protein QXY40_10645 [Candidatus Methanomethylicia archaeon]